MLDEVKEVESYLKNPDAHDVRVGAKLLFDNYKECKLNGLADILTLVVCQYLFEYNCGKKLNDELKNKAILIMRIWCGFDEDVKSDELMKAKQENKQWFVKYPQAEGWLRNYYVEHSNKKKCCDWSKYSEKWKNSLNSGQVYQAERICYENIIAQAVARGALKKYNLVVKKEYEDIMNNDVRNENGKKPDARKKKTILKLLAAYKILQLQHPNQKYVLLQTNRVLNWLGYKSDKKDRWCLKFKWCGEPIFLMDSHGDFKKFAVNQAFLEKIDVQLKEKQADERLEGYNIYLDDGHGKELIKL